jgi:hypothetical protein
VYIVAESTTEKRKFLPVNQTNAAIRFAGKYTLTKLSFARRNLIFNKKQYRHLPNIERLVHDKGSRNVKVSAKGAKSRIAKVFPSPISDINQEYSAISEDKWAQNPSFNFKSLRLVNIAPNAFHEPYR